ncbi:MAG: Protein LemA [Desulfovibrio sp.]
MTALLIIGGVLGVAAVFAISIYNKLVALKAGYKNAFAQIEVQLKRRYDLIPNIVETAKAYMKHESETLTKVIEARNGAVSALEQASAAPGSQAAINGLNAAEKNLSGAFTGMRLQFEQYPDLKANTIMMQLSEELTATENRVAFARQAYNDAATTYNTQRAVFPANIMANMFGHTEDAALLVFEDSAAIQSAPKVSF